jgi:hypothetical protein
MFLRVTTAAFAAGLLVQPLAAEPTAPTVAKYRVTISAHSVVDLAAFGGGSQETTNIMSGFFTITTADTTGGRTFHAVLDSMHLDSVSLGREVMQAMADSAKGAAWHGFVTPNGNVQNLQAVGGNPGAQQFEGVLAAFYPRGTQGRKAGQTWTDTLSYTSATEQGTTTITSITTYTAAGEATHEGVKALKITSTGTSTTSGVLNQQGGEAQLEGTGTTVGTWYLTRDGIYLGGQNDGNNDMTVTMPTAPMPIPVKARTTVTVAKL